MAWNKLGRIFCANKQHDWMQSHASTPCAVPKKDGSIRVYFSTRDADNKSSITFLDMKLQPEPKILYIHTAPIISPGKAGYFDDNGVTIAQILQTDTQQYAYYVGWNLTNHMPFRNSIGLATAPIQSDNFSKHSLAPIIDRSAIDPISLSYPWILKEDNTWHMWYGSHITVEENNLDVEHVIKYAHSTDGINWKRHGHICIALHEGESGIVRPCVMRNHAEYQMWYSIRIGKKETYKIGYAASKDGVNWHRQDDAAGISASTNADDWDHEMICYPYIFDHQNTRYMLYNGNGFGRTGFGLATWEEP